MFSRLWAIYAIALFLLMMAISLPVLAFNMVWSPGKKALRRNIWYLHHIFTPIFLALIGVRIQVNGLENLEKNQSYIIVCNHRTTLDFIVSAAAYPGVFRFLAKSELMRIPIFGWVVKKMCLTVDRRNAASRAQSILALKEQLETGWSVFVYPEGSRNQSDQDLAPFFDGAFRLAIQTGAPIAVQTLVGMERIAGPGSELKMRPGLARIYWDAPVTSTGMSMRDLDDLKQSVRERMIRRLNA